MINKKILGLIGLSAKARKISFGSDSVEDSICFTHYFGADYADRIFLFRLIDSPQVTQFCMDGDTLIVDGEYPC